MATEITRDIGTMDPALLTAPERQHVFDFLKIEIPAVDIDHTAQTLRYTKLSAGFTGDIDGAAQIWSFYDWIPEGLSNTNSSILEVSALNVANIHGLFTMYNLGWGLQGRRVTIWRAQFEDDDLTLIGKTIMFQGRIDEVSCKDRAKMTLIPFRSAFDVLIPGPTYSRTMCAHLRNYKGPFCQYAGAIETCDGTLDGPNGCRVHDNIIHYGAFPKLPKRGTAVIWGKKEAPQHYTL